MNSKKIILLTFFFKMLTLSWINCFNQYPHVFYPEKLDFAKPVIYIFGDSHCLAFKNIENCIIYHVGPRTMYRIGNSGIDILNPHKFDIKENNIVIFCFGEIDVRCHILKQAFLKKLDPNFIINDLVKNYLNEILKIKRLLKNNLSIIIYGVVPPSNKCPSSDYPIYGSLNERIEITKVLNSKLEIECRKINFLFLNVFDDYSNNGILNNKLSDGCIHINPDFNHGIKKKLFELIKYSTN